MAAPLFIHEALYTVHGGPFLRVLFPAFLQQAPQTFSHVGLVVIVLGPPMFFGDIY